MISKLKEKSIQKFYNKTILKAQNKEQQQYKIKKIAVLLDNPSIENKIIADLTTKFPFQKENITVLIYKPFEKKDKNKEESQEESQEENQQENIKIFTEKDIGFKASLKSDNLKNFVKIDYDALINYIKTPNLYTNTITLLSQARLKTGFANIDERLYNLIIADDGFDETILNQELKKYLTILNKI
ncbi:DUF6913 domain-containing protein [Tenacibaculum piscium]|uniref:DUF6913 domain-containing protein n=1 Tax=Tenacibaculum piscium TaxID=1458515 RepID=UPI001F19D7A7|nr:hypothetical protein [Tenacibaculum piscium]